MTTTKPFDNLNLLVSIANVGVSSGNYTPNTLNQNASRTVPNTWTRDLRGEQQGRRDGEFAGGF